ncbi:MAG: DUF4198 domain-containing protein [Bacteroidota bacterium]
MNWDKRRMIRKGKNRLYRSFCLLMGMLLLCSHDLYLKMDTYFVQPQQEARLSLYNGTFERSENIITRDRMLDASVVAQGERTLIDSAQWQDQDSTITHLTLLMGEAGTYVAGVSTKARNIELEAEKFNSYLEHDGVLDMLTYRQENNLMAQDAVESYQKHVKAIYQVGNVKTDDWKTILGYPIEFVPQANPYETYSGGKLDVQLLLDGKPLPNQLVYANHLTHAHHTHDGHTHEHHGAEHSHEHDGAGHSHDDAHHEHHAEEEAHTHTGGQQLRTNEAGMLTIELPEDGIYYLRTIYMENVADSDELTHRSTWGTLTFEVSHQHGADTHTHDDHAHEEEILTLWFVLGSLLLIGGLFLVFRKKNA